MLLKDSKYTMVCLYGCYRVCLDGTGRRTEGMAKVGDGTSEGQVGEGGDERGRG